MITIDRAHIIQFSDMMHIKSQQIRSRLRPNFQVIPMVGDKFAYDGLGNVEAREVQGRIQKVIFDDIEHLRRKIGRRRFVVTLPIDQADVRGILIDPQGRYAEACTRAMERVFDRVGIEAALADVYTGENFETTVSFATDGGNTVTATAGVTYEKLLELNKFWINNEVGTDMPEKKMLLFTGTEHEALMKEIELTSGDYSRKYVVDRGEITEGLGIQFIPYGASVPSPLLSVASTTRSCIGLTSRGLVYGLSKEFGISVEKRTDLVETSQVQIIGELGAVRTEGLLVQKFTTTV